MKILVVHPAQQHSYRLATALSKKGMLERYVTTVYCKKYSLTNLIAFFLKGDFKKKAKARVCQEINDTEVLQFCEIEGLIKLLTMNIKMLRPFYKKMKYYTADRFAKKVVHYAIKHQVDAVVGYDDCSAVLFEKLKNDAPDILRIMDMSAANIIYMRQIYEKDIILQPSFADKLKKEREIVWNSENIERAEKEIKYAQIFLAPSTFVAKSLKFSGVSNENIKICPYGVDTIQFPQRKYRNYDEKTEKILRFIYVGGVKELKGIGYLLEAFEEFSPSEVELTVIGQYDPNEECIQKYKKQVRFTGSILHSKVAEYLLESDVFIFPSLGEGLSLSCLEAASCGLPLIVTENSGVNDAMEDGKEGFIVPIQSKECLAEKIRWFLKNPQKIESMGRAARQMAMQYNWEVYYSRMGRIFDELANEKEK